MENSEFDKYYAAKMRQGSAPDFSEEDWGRLSPLLVAEQKRRWRAFPLWWLAALSALLVCSNLGWWWMWQQSDARSKSLQQEWQQMRKEVVIKQDTSWSKVVVYQYDTVYRTVILRSLSVPQVANNTGFSLGTNPKQGMATNPGTEALNTSTVLPATTNPVSLSTASAPNSATTHPTSPAYEAELGLAHVPVDVATAQALDFIHIPFQTTHFNIPTRPIKVPDAELVFVPLQKANTPKQDLLIPRNFRLGAGAGMCFPVAEGFSESFGFSANLSTEIAFSDHLALVLDGSYSSLSFKSSTYDEQYGLPPIATPGDDYRLHYIETEEELKSIWQMGAGFRYWFQPSKKLSPYLGLGYAAQWHPEYELKLEFTHKVTNEEKERSIEVPALNGISYFDFNAGLRYRFLRKLYLQTGGFYQLKIDQAKPGIPGYWGIKTAVLYAF